MDRDLLYPGQIGLVENTLDAFKAAMVAVAISSEAVLGQSTQVFGFAITPLSNTAVGGSAFAVSIDRGAIFSYEETDANAYGVIGTDTTNILKTGINLSVTSVAISNASPSPAGYSVNYLVSAQFEEMDTNPVGLPFYNTGGAPTTSEENLTRTQRVIFSVIGGTQAVTGTQTTPSAPAGSVPLYVVTVTNGQTSVGSGDIVVAIGAPFITNLPALESQVDTVSNNLASEIAVRSAQAGNFKNAVSIYSTTTMTASQQGSFIEIAAGTAVTTTLPTPIGEAGALWRIFNSSSYTQTLRTAAAIFIGPGGSGTASVALLPGQIVEAASDNAAWVLSSIGVPKPRYGASQSGIVSAADTMTYTVASVAFTFPPYSRTGGFRILARLVNSGFTTASGTTRQNFTNILSDGTNNFTGADWLCVSVSTGDSFGFSDTILTSTTYAPGAPQTFTMGVRTAGGDSAFSIQGCYMELYVEEA